METRSIRFLSALVVAFALAVACVAPASAHSSAQVKAQGLIFFPLATISGNVNDNGSSLFQPEMQMWKLGPDSVWTLVDTDWADSSGNYSFNVWSTGAYRVGLAGFLNYGSGTYYQSAYWSSTGVKQQPQIAETINVVSGSYPGHDLNLHPAIAANPQVTGMVTDSGGATLTGGFWIRVATAATGSRPVYPRAFAVFKPDGKHFKVFGVPFSTVQIAAASGGGFGEVWYDGHSDRPSAKSIATTDLPAQNINIKLKKGSSRIYGADRFSTAAEYQFDLNSPLIGRPNLVLASGDDAAATDALAAAGLCRAYGNAPLGLLSKLKTPASTKELALATFDANGWVNIHVVGNTTNVPGQRLTDIVDYIRAQRGQLAAVSWDRVSGTDRYGTAAAVRTRMSQLMVLPPQVVLVNGADAAKLGDALAVSALAGSAGIPILYVSSTAAPAVTRSALASYSASNVFVAGGASTVSSALMSNLSIPAGNRWGGATRYDVAVNVANQGIARGVWAPDYAVAVAAKFADAIAGGSSGYGPVLLCSPTALPPATSTWLHSKATAVQLDAVYVMGGPASVSAPVKSTIDGLMQ